MHARRHVTFALPGDFRSGGVRVTVQMANLLLARGYQVRIAHPLRSGNVLAAVRQSYRRWVKGHGANSGWLHEFKGRIETYRNLDQLEYSPDEVVIAVGTFMVDDVRRMTKPVGKVRFNHGFPAQPDAQQATAWTGRMTTITVSNTLVPRLQELTGGSVWGVVPNGIARQQYRIEPGVVRDGIGGLYNVHPNKAPQDFVAVLQEAHRRWPNVPQYAFGTEAQPASLQHLTYHRYPPVAEARRIYNRSKIWLLTSLTEGLPGAVLEAMACGCVMVTSDNDGSLEIVRHEQNGLVAPRGNRTAFLEQIERLLTDDSLCRRLSTAAQETADRFSWERAADRMEEFLQATPWLEGAEPRKSTA